MNHIVSWEIRSRNRSTRFKTHYVIIYLFYHSKQPLRVPWITGKVQTATQ